MEILLLIGFLAALGLLFNSLLGYRKNNIIIDLDQRYTSLQDHTEAVIQELQQQDREVESVGNRKLKIDGTVYILRERTVNVARVPLQRTILIPKKIPKT